MGNLAHMYLRGLGVAVDAAEAVRWYRQAVERAAPVNFPIFAEFVTPQVWR